MSKKMADKRAQVKPQLKAIIKYLLIAFFAIALIYIITKVILPAMDIM